MAIKQSDAFAARSGGNGVNGATFSPLLDSWQTDWSASIFGACLEAVIVALAFGLRETGFAFSILHQAVLLVAMVQGIAGCVWAISCYPSLFSGKPKANTSRMACALNGLFGGPLLFFFMDKAVENASTEKSYSSDSWHFNSLKRKLYAAPGAAAAILNLMLVGAECFMILGSLFFVV